MEKILIVNCIQKTTHLDLLHDELSDTDNRSDQKHNSHASTPIAENQTDITASTTSELERFCKAATQIYQRNECYLLTLTQQCKEDTVDFS